MNFYENFAPPSLNGNLIPLHAMSHAHKLYNTMESPTSNPAPPRKRARDLPLSRRYAIAAEIASEITPGKFEDAQGLSKRIGPLAERYDVGPQYPTQLWVDCKKR